MSLFQFASAYDGYRKAHGGEEKVAPATEADYYELIEKYG